MMISPVSIKKQMEVLTADLVGLGLCDQQNFPKIKTYREEVVEISAGLNENLSFVLKDVAYYDIYTELDKRKSFNFKMLDGALLHMQYRFRKGSVETHRLAFFPSPSLEDFQNNPEVYLEDEIYAEVIKKNIVPFPIRFDFDNRPEIHREIEHPMSHLTLGQYSNCRMPVSSPLTPYEFVSFVLRSFYNTAYNRYCDRMTVFDDSFDATISDIEAGLVHFNIPKL